MIVKASFLILCISLFAHNTAEASVANVYIAQNSTGIGDGSSCGNARAVSFFNTAGNWGSGSTQIGQDTTVHLCGSISTQLLPKGNGASGHPITILWESGARLSSPAWGDTSGAAVYVTGQTWLVF